MKILVSDEIAHEGLKVLEKDQRVELDVRPGIKRDELLSIIGGYDGIITRSGTTVDRELLDAGKNLKIVARAGVGIDNVDVDHASKNGVIVVNAPFGNTNSAAEHAMALLLAFCRNVPKANASLKSGDWKRAPFTGHELKGRKAGVIGLGKVGGRVATRLKAFECDVVACDPYIAEKRAQDLGVSLVSHEEIYRTCDIITFHTPLNDETRDMVGERELSIMKEGVIIINAARGGIVNEEALLSFLKSGKPTGAAFDVWSEEPPKSPVLQELIAQERLIVTPHLGANTFEAQVNVAVDVSHEILRFLDDQPLENAVNIPRFDLALMDQMRPFLNLVNVMSEFVIQLLDTNINKVTFAYSGQIAAYDCAPITVCGLSALLNRTVEQDVNMVNASLVAANMGIAVDETKNPESESFSNLITIIIEGPGEKRLISGALFEGIPRIVKLRDYQMDFRPEEYMLLLAYEDRPGMIGKIGMILGEHDINIASMNLGRREKKGEAMVIISMDSPVSQSVVQELIKATDATFVKPLHLGTARVR